MPNASVLLEINIQNHCIVIKEHSHATLLQIPTLPENIRMET